MRRLLVLLPVLGGLAVAASAHGSSGYRIAYTRSTHGQEQIFTVSSAGGHLRQLTSGPRYGEDPAFSRDRTRLVYSWGTDSRDPAGAWDIWTMNADGSGKRRITFTPRIAEENPSWSPDGSKIAFTTPTGLWVMSSDGGDRRRLLRRTEARGPFGTPSWSPDGAEIVIADVPQGDSGNLYTVSVAAGGAQRRLPKGFAPAWSPDGRTILFARQRNATSSDLWLVDADGTGLRPLTNTPRLFEVFSSWSPDGSQIAFWANERARVPDSLTLFVMNADGSGRRSLGVTTTSPWWGGLGS